MPAARVAQGERVPLFEDWHVDPMPLYVAFAPNRHISIKLRVFIEWVAELMAQHAPLATPAGRR
jgi:DNA-binding transcriptional LysR family regulator